MFAPLHITIVYHSTPGSHLRLATTARIRPERAPRCLNKRPRENRRTSTLLPSLCWRLVNHSGPAMNKPANRFVFAVKTLDLLTCSVPVLGVPQDISSRNRKDLEILSYHGLSDCDWDSSYW
jgi:hypothetical protein